jgi:ribosomal protein S18 acetylase RimI-like enzyme
MDFVDMALARRLEAAEEIPQVHCAELLQQHGPAIHAAAEEIGGGHMVFAGLGSPIGRAVGIGLDGPVSAELLDRIEEFYRSHGAPTQVDVCPLTHSSLLELLKNRRYYMSELNNVLFRRVSREERFDGPPVGVEITRGNREEADVFTDIVARSFFPKGDAPREFSTWLMPLFQYEDAVTFLATANGTPAGSGVGQRMHPHNIFAFFGDGTLSEYRGRGIQQALIRERLKLAAELGCDTAVVITQGGTTSQRNYERLGFRVAYSKATLVKDVGS